MPLAHLKKDTVPAFVGHRARPASCSTRVRAPCSDLAVLIRIVRSSCYPVRRTPSCPNPDDTLCFVAAARALCERCQLAACDRESAACWSAVSGLPRSAVPGCISRISRIRILRSVSGLLFGTPVDPGTFRIPIRPNELRYSSNTVVRSTYSTAVYPATVDLVRSSRSSE